MRLSAVQDRFLEFVERNPEALDRTSFWPLTEIEKLFRYPVQVWPLFIDESLRRKLAEASVAVSRLVRSLPVRVFENDPVRLGEFYGHDTAQMETCAALCQRTSILDEAIGRGDYLLTEDGRIQCLELNMAGSLGGVWETLFWVDRYQQVPVLRRFLDETGTVPVYTHSLRLAFEHLVDRSLDLAQNGELSMGIAVTGWSFPQEVWSRHGESSYRAALDRHGLDGALHQAPREAFTERGGELWLEGRRIHILLDGDLGVVSRPMIRAQMSGRARVYNGAVTRVLSDKQNFALLSELAGSDLFTADERRDIALYVPWTRRLEPGFTTWRDERAYLPDLAVEMRERFVLKPSNGLGGEGILIGSRTAPEVWNAAVEAALGATGWLLQEAVEPAEHPLLERDLGCVPCRTVWGLFTFGNNYGGLFARMSPSTEPSGVVNTARGASLGLVLDVPDEA